MALELNGTTGVTFNNSSVSSVGGIGDGQTWQNQSGVKSVNTTYTNTTGKPIMVSISQASTGQQNIYINGNQIAQISQNATNSSGYAFIVPNGDTYRIDTNQPSWWWELR